MERGRIGKDIDIFYLNLGEARFLYDEIFEAQSYVKHGISLDGGSVVFDVGANIGLVGVYLHHRWPGIRLYCFEPIPDAFAVLEANVKLHGLQARLFPCALGDDPGTAIFTFYPNNSVMSGRYAQRVEDADTTRAFIANKNPALLERAKQSTDFQQHVDSMLSRLFQSREVTCPVRRLSEVIATEKIERIDLLKIDVEKAEHEVIAGIDEPDWAKVRQVVVEMHDIDGRVTRFTDLLERHGFTVVVEQDPALATANIYNIYGRR
jgi:FkbM family methyltransferase